LLYREVLIICVINYFFATFPGINDIFSLFTFWVGCVGLETNLHDYLEDHLTRNCLLRKWKPVEVDVFVNDNMTVITLFIYSLLYFLFFILFFGELFHNLLGA
jgi:hypothetical protein